MSTENRENDTLNSIYFYYFYQLNMVDMSLRGKKRKKMGMIVRELLAVWHELRCGGYSRGTINMLEDGSEQSWPSSPKGSDCLQATDWPKQK